MGNFVANTCFLLFFRRSCLKSKSVFSCLPQVKTRGYLWLSPFGAAA
jgi:hypothetical protein